MPSGFVHVAFCCIYFTALARQNAEIEKQVALNSAAAATRTTKMPGHLQLYICVVDVIWHRGVEGREDTASTKSPSTHKRNDKIATHKNRNESALSPATWMGLAACACVVCTNAKIVCDKVYLETHNGVWVCARHQIITYLRFKCIHGCRWVEARCDAPKYCDNRVSMCVCVANDGAIGLAPLTSLVSSSSICRSCNGGLMGNFLYSVKGWGWGRLFILV